MQDRFDFSGSPRDSLIAEGSQAADRDAFNEQIQAAPNSQLPSYSERVEEAPKKPSGGRGKWATLILWLSVASLILLILYLVLVYANDQRARESRNRKHNLNNYVDYAMSVSEQLPKGHIEHAKQQAELPEEMKPPPEIKK